MLYVVYDLATLLFEVPSGYMSDRLGRRKTLVASTATFLASVLLLIVGSTFVHFAIANVLLGAGMAFASGTDSALLFESLKANGREKRIAEEELKAWRFGFVALALAALIGGALAVHNDVLPYVATALAACFALVIAFRFNEPSHSLQAPHQDSLRSLAASLRHPTLIWLLCLTVLLYTFGHIPFVFGQPFIREALATTGLADQTPLVSGAVSFVMMMISVAVSLIALPIRKRLGLPATLLLALGMQVALTTALATSNGVFVIALLFLRMVPDSLSEPFINARIQPLLTDGIRATYFSLQSLAGRVLFALTLSVAATQSPGDAALPYSVLQPILAAFALLGIVLWLGLAATSRRARV